MVIKVLRKHAIPHYIIKTNTIKDIIQSIKIIGKKIKKETKANNIIEQINKTINQLKIKKSSHSYTAMVILGLAHQSNQFYIVGKDNYFSTILEYLDVKNAYQGNIPYPQISLEKLIKLNPDIIITITSEQNSQIEQREKNYWINKKYLKAIQNKKYFFLNHSSLSLPGSQLNKTLKQFIQIIRPEWKITYKKKIL